MLFLNSGDGGGGEGSGQHREHTGGVKTKQIRGVKECDDNGKRQEEGGDPGRQGGESDEKEHEKTVRERHGAEVVMQHYLLPTDGRGRQHGVTAVNSVEVGGNNNIAEEGAAAESIGTTSKVKSSFYLPVVHRIQ